MRFFIACYILLFTPFTSALGPDPYPTPKSEDIEYYAQELGDNLNSKVWREKLDDIFQVKRAENYFFHMNMLAEFSPKLNEHYASWTAAVSVAALHKALSPESPMGGALEELVKDPCIVNADFDMEDRLCRQAAVAAYIRQRYEHYEDWMATNFPELPVDREIWVEQRAGYEAKHGKPLKVAPHLRKP